MALTELERKRCERALERFLERRRPPPHIRPDLDIGYRVSGPSVQVHEIRPDWQDPQIRMEHPVAKATFVRSKNRWRVFCMKSDLKWHAYEPSPEVQSLEAFLNVVDRDDYRCFFG